MVDSPENSDNTRRLMAIMFTDIKGYTAMMGENEGATVELVLEHREIVRESIARNDGHEHETIGDAFVVLFESVVNAVRCAVDVQERLAERNKPLPEERQVWIRIGVHLGDIILREGGIYGDAVNMSARVQDRGQPGGVCVTEQVKMHIQGRVDVPMISMGTLPLKGIRHPPQLYRLDIPSARGPVASIPVAESAATGRKLVFTAAALALVIGGAFAVSAEFGAASHPTTKTVIDAAAVPVPAAESNKSAQELENSAKPPAVAPSKQPAIAPSATGATAQNAADNDNKVAADLVVAAQSETGQSRVELLTEAVKRAPDNTAYQMLLKTALKHAKARTHRARRGHTAKASATPKPALPAKPTIRRHVVED